MATLTTPWEKIINGPEFRQGWTSSMKVTDTGRGNSFLSFRQIRVHQVFQPRVLGRMVSTEKVPRHLLKTSRIDDELVSLRDSSPVTGELPIINIPCGGAFSFIVLHCG